MSTFKLTLATRKFSKENKVKSLYLSLSTFIFLVTSLCLTITFDNVIISLLFSILSGLLSLRMFVIYHDYLHEAILPKSKFARVMFTVFGMYILVPRRVWKSSHDFHHRNNSKLHKTHIGSFPVVTKSSFIRSSKIEKKRYLWTRHPLFILSGYVFTFIIGMCLKPLKSNFIKHIDSFYALAFHFSLQAFILLLFGFQSWILFSIIPNFIAGAIGTYLFYVQHNFPEVKLKSGKDWAYESAALESSSFIKMSRIMQWFTANIGYHHIHHLNSRIPFYRLPEVMNEFEELQKPKTTTFKMKDIMQCLSLKLWDEESKKMIGLNPKHYNDLYV